MLLDYLILCVGTKFILEVLYIASFSKVFFRLNVLTDTFSVRFNVLTNTFTCLQYIKK